MLDQQMSMWNDTQDDLWQAVMAKDSRFDGTFVFAVSSTKIYCRPSCPSRRPGRERVSYFRLPAAAEQAGFRACRRCRPKRTTSTDPQVEMVQRACRYIETQDESSVTLADLGKHIGISAFHLQRVFKKVMGITPRQYADACRIGKFKTRVRESGSVAGAMYDAGFSSSSRLYGRASAELGMTPATYSRGGRGAIIKYTITPCSLDTITPCSLGLLLVAATERGVCAVKLGDSDAALASDLTREYPSAEIHRADSLSEPVDKLLNSFGQTARSSTAFRHSGDRLSMAGVGKPARDTLWRNQVIWRGRQSDGPTDGRARGRQGLRHQPGGPGYSLPSRDSRRQKPRWLSLGSGTQGSSTGEGEFAGT